MASLQGALPNMGAAQTGIMRTSSLGTPPPQTWMPPQSSYPTAMLSQAQSYASAMPPSNYLIFMSCYLFSSVPYLTEICYLHF